MTKLLDFQLRLGEEVLPSEELSRGDTWVLVVAFDAHFVSPCGADCQQFDREEVFLEYVTGAHVMSRN